MSSFSPPLATSSNTSLRNVISISELNRQAKRLLEISFPSIWIEGEISNFVRPSSGHWYFTLKDRSAQVRSAMFRNSNLRVQLSPKDGIQVLVRARVSLYEGRGEYQLIVDHMEEAGEGVLRLAFETLKNRLAKEGLFDEIHKQPLPSMPTHIGVITSPTGAVICDILTVLNRRFPATQVTIIPTAVQGKEAAGQIVNALQLAGRTRYIDALILGRGGGSLEDLWPFNEESVVRAIVDCKLPIVSAVGHEIDYTLADLAADHRAATPSIAAELLSQNQSDWRNKLAAYQRKLTTLINSHRHLQQQALHALSSRLRHPGQKIQKHNLRLDDLSIRLQQAMRHQLLTSHNTLILIDNRFKQSSPLHLPQQLTLKNRHLDLRLNASMQSMISRMKQQMRHLTNQLETLSPLATLARGYAMAQTSDGTIIRNSQMISAEESIKVSLAEGHLDCIVTKTHDLIGKQ